MIGSWTDWKLTKVGEEQAHNIGINLKREIGENKKFFLYSSTLTRTKQTSEIIKEYLDIEQVIYTESLKERSLGKAIGKSVQWLKENIESEENTINDRCFSDAESRKDVWDRLLEFYNDLMKNDQENIIIVSHGDTLSVFNVMWLLLEAQHLNNIDLYGVSGGVSFLYQNDKGKRIIKRLSDTSFMKIIK
eukprot:gene10761-13175_t